MPPVPVKQQSLHGRRAVGKKSKTAPATAPTIEDADADAPAGASEPSDEAAADDVGDEGAAHQRQGDRGSAEDAGARLPVYCRYRALEEAGIVSSWMMLRRLIERENFPRGLMLGKNTRAWALADVKAWLAGRPSAPKPVNVAKQMTTRRRRQEEEAAVSAEN